MKKKSTLLLTGSTILALTLSACGGSSEGSKLSDVNYTMNGATAAPSVAFETPFAANGTEVYKIEDGSGETISDGDNLLVDATAFNGSDASQLGSTLTDSPILISVDQNLKDAVPELYNMLVGSKVGVNFSYTTNVDPNSTSTAESTPTVSPGTPTNVEVYTVLNKIMNKAEGESSELDTPGVQSFEQAEDGTATLTLSEDRGDAPTELATQDLITGTGDTVTESDTLYVNYVGVTWADGTSFDGNYGATPVALSLNNVIEGWKQGLVGKTVGSRVLMVIPSELAYGEDAASSGAPEGALVFVVDILGAIPTRTSTAEATPTETATADPSATATSSESATPSETESEAATESASPSGSESASN